MLNKSYILSEIPSNALKWVPNMFPYCRADGREVMVDNKFLKANNPLLVIYVAF